MVAESIDEPRGELGRYFLARLERLLAREGASRHDIDTARLIHLAVYSTYADCLDLGVGETARAILARHRFATAC